MFSWLKSAPEPTRNVSRDEVTLEALDARLRRIEQLLSVPCAARQPVELSAHVETLAGALASYGRAVAREEEQRARG
jgi:hypothetical protein